MRIVVKVGTNVLTNNAEKINPGVVQNLVEEIFELKSRGHEIILVSSGAVSLGREKINHLDSAENKQVWASVGQPLLLGLYSKFSARFGAQVGQLLILRSELTDRERYGNLVAVINAMLKTNVLPVINGNDVISVADLVAGDNDSLAGMVAVALAADKLVILTNQKGFFTADPRFDKSAALVREVQDVDFELERMCSGAKSSGGRGGMLSKIRAAKHAVQAGIETQILDGREKGILLRALDGTAVGTKFLAPKRLVLSEQKRWLLAAKGFGQLVIDDGAVRALRENKSLLFPGIISFRGMFDKSEIVEVINKIGQAVAYGKTNYGFKDIQSSMAVRKALGKARALDKEVIHCDHMAVLEKTGNNH